MSALQISNFQLHNNICSPNLDQAEPSAEAQQGLEDLWDNVSGELSAIFQGRGEVPTDVTPFDAASEVEVDQQRFV